MPLSPPVPWPRAGGDSGTPESWGGSQGPQSGHGGTVGHQRVESGQWNLRGMRGDQWDPKGLGGGQWDPRELEWVTGTPMWSDEVSGTPKGWGAHRDPIVLGGDSGYLRGLGGDSGTPEGWGRTQCDPHSLSPSPSCKMRPPPGLFPLMGGDWSPLGHQQLEKHRGPRWHSRKWGRWEGWGHHPKNAAVMTPPGVLPP